MQKHKLFLLFIPFLFFQCHCKKEIEENPLQYDSQGVKIRMPYLWKTKIAETDENGGAPPSVVYENKILVKGEIDHMAAMHLLNIDDGSIIWSKKFFNTDYFSIAPYESYVYKNSLVFNNGSCYNLNFLTGEFQWSHRQLINLGDATGIDSLYFATAQGKTSYNKDSIDGVYVTQVNDGNFKEVYVPNLGNIHFNSRIALNGPGGVSTILPYKNSNGDIMLLLYIWSGKDRPSEDDWIDLYNYTKKEFVFQYDTIQGGLSAFPPIVYHNKVYHTLDDTTGVHIQCFDLENQKLVWSHETGLHTGLYGSVIAEGELIVVVGDVEKYTMALDLGTGAVAWKRPSTAGQSSSKMWYLNGVVYFASVTDAKLHAIEAATGKELWRMDPPDYPADSNDYLDGNDCTVIPGKNGEKGKVIVISMKHAYCFEAER